MKRLLPRLLVSIFITVGLVWWVSRQGLPIVPEAATFEHLKWWAVPGFISLLALVHWWRAWRWRYLVQPLSDIKMRKLMAVAFVGFFAILMLPLRMGEFARPWLLKRESGQRTSMSAGFGTIAIERVVDGVLVSLWLTLALFAVDPGRSEWVWWLRLGPLGLFVASLVVLVAFVVSPGPVREVVRVASGLGGKRVQGFAMHVLDGFNDGLKSLPSRHHVLGFVLWSVVYWGINVLAFWVLAAGCGLELGPLGSVAAMGILAVGILLPAGVGLFGNFQASLLIALALFVPTEVVNHQGALFIFINYLGQLVLTAAAGIWGMAATSTNIWGVIDRSAREQGWDHVA